MEADWVARSLESVERFRRRHRIGLVTLLFTDIIDSTALKQRLGDASAVELIQRHHSVVRALLGRFSEGEEIETAGDSFFIVFAKPSDAVKFSLLLQAKLRALANESSCAVFDRVGIHVGEVFIDDQPHGRRSRDLFGLQVDTAARVMSLGGAHQILLSRFAFDSARQVLKGEDISGIGPLSWLNHGTYLLKGIDEPVEVCEVGENGKAALVRPQDSEKAHRQVAVGEEPVLGWRPAACQTVPKTEWVLEKNLGEGGFGEVWLGRHKTLKQARVFKFCFNADRVRSLKREVTIFRVLKESVGDHPNIVAIEDVLFEEPPFYIVMEYVDGDNLIEWCKAQGGAEAITTGIRLEVVSQIADALQAAHESGVIHRDVKPQNILIEQRNGSIRAKLTDFGIGKVLSEEVLTGITRLGFTETIDSSGSQSGTQMYMAPEIIVGQQATTQSDIYSLGIVLYQLLIGDFSRPLTTDWDEEVTDLLLRDDLRHCFSRDPQKRFAAAKQLAEKLRTMPERQAALSREQAAAAARKQAAARRAQRKRWITVTATSLAALAAAISSILWWHNWAATKQLLHLRDELTALRNDPNSSAYEVGNISERVLRLSPNDSKVWPIYCKALLNQGRDDEFNAALARWRTTTPVTPEAEDLLGDSEMKHGHQQSAIQHWRNFVQSTAIDLQQRTQTWAKLADAYGRLGQWEQARSVLNEWIRAQDNVHARMLRARANQQLRNWEAVRDDLDFARRTDPSNAEVKSFGPIVDDAQTIDLISQRIRKTPRDATAWIARAHELTKYRQFQAALEDIEHARNLDPDSISLRIEKVYLLSQMHESIPRELEVMDSPGWSPGRTPSTADLQVFLHQLDELRELDARVQAQPSDPSLYLARGKRLAQLGHHLLGIRDFTKCMTVGGDSLDALRARAASYRAIGDTTHALIDETRVQQLEHAQPAGSTR